MPEAAIAVVLASLPTATAFDAPLRSMSPEIVVDPALMSLAERKKYPAANRRTSVLPPEGMTMGVPEKSKSA